jgi:7,8-dihydropterin-6-yl-methyl-4-(beta-D-ribofuranosyl)aminobenzene 5'-phosphate synthase
VVFDLEPVDSVTVTTLIDNLTDVFMPDQGPARRPPVVPADRRPVATMAGGQAPEALIAEHGLSVLVTVTKNGRRHRILYDAGASPDGVVENMRRLDVDPSGIEVIVCSHGHFDHTTVPLPKTSSVEVRPHVHTRGGCHRGGRAVVCREGLSGAGL